MLTVIAAEFLFIFFLPHCERSIFFPSVLYQPQFLPHFPFRSLFYLRISAVSGVREGGAEGGRDFLPQSAVLSAATCQILCLAPALLHSSSPVFPHSPSPPRGSLICTYATVYLIEGRGCEGNTEQHVVGQHAATELQCAN